MIASTPSTFDFDMMRIAVRMAMRGLGNCAPNPAVGAVIADEESGEVIARGWTQPGGRPHAETEAIRRAGDRARDATLYVTLEPCAHIGQTPPCADAIIAAGLKRVVVGTGDPDPRTAGAGIAKLRAAGLTVAEHVFEADARWVTLGHLLRVTQKRPFVTLKLATDAAGRIVCGDGTQPRWVTGTEARAAGHKLRAEADAILIGAGTLRADNPDLTCRLPGLFNRSPSRIVVAGQERIAASAKLFATAREVPVLVLRSRAASPDDHHLVAAGADIVEVPETTVSIVLEMLADRGITRVLVEGGPTIWRSFAHSGFVDEVILFMAGTADRQQAGAALEHYLEGLMFDTADRRPVGSDSMWRLRQAGA